MTTTQHQRGFSIIELLMAITIGLLLIIGVYQVYRENLADTQAKQMADAVRVLLRDAEHVTATRQDFRIDDSGSIRALTINDIMTFRSNELPPGLNMNGTNVRNSWGGLVSMTSTNIGAFSHGLMRVRMAGVPSEVCLRVLSQLAGENYDMFVGADLVGLSPAADADGPGRNTLRFPQAAPLCASAATVTMDFRVLKDIKYTSLRRTPFDTMTAAETTRVNTWYAHSETALALRETAQLAIP